MEEMLYTVQDVATILKTNVDYVHKLRRRGLITFMKLGSYKCRKAELERFLMFAEGKDFSDLDHITELKLT